MNLETQTNPEAEKLSPPDGMDLAYWNSLPDEIKKEMLAGQQEVQAGIETSTVNDRDALKGKSTTEQHELQKEIPPPEAVILNQQATVLDSLDGQPSTPEVIAQRQAALGLARDTIKTAMDELPRDEQQKLKEVGHDIGSAEKGRGRATEDKDGNLIASDDMSPETSEDQQRFAEVQSAFDEAMAKLPDDDPQHERWEVMIVQHGKAAVVEAFADLLRYDAFWKGEEFRENPDHDVDGEWQLAKNSDRIGDVMQSVLSYADEHPEIRLDDALFIDSKREQLAYALSHPTKDDAPQQMAA